MHTCACTHEHAHAHAQTSSNKQTNIHTSKSTPNKSIGNTMHQSVVFSITETSTSITKEDCGWISTRHIDHSMYWRSYDYGWTESLAIDVKKQEQLLQMLFVLSAIRIINSTGMFFSSPRSNLITIWYALLPIAPNYIHTLQSLMPYSNAALLINRCVEIMYWLWPLKCYVQWTSQIVTHSSSGGQLW